MWTTTETTAKREPLYMPVARVAELVGVPEGKLNVLINFGMLPYLKVGDAWLVTFEAATDTLADLSQRIAEHHNTKVVLGHFEKSDPPTERADDG